MSYIGSPEVAFPRRRFSDHTPYVGAMMPVKPGVASLAVSACNTLSGVWEVAKRGLTNPWGWVRGAKGLLTGLVGLGENWFGGSSVVGVPIFFQYFPDQVTDSRESGIHTESPPGLSDPLPVSAGASQRRISLTAYFSQERWPGPGRRLTEWDKYNFDVGLAVQALRMFAYPAGMNIPLVGTTGVSPQPLVLTLPNTRIGIDSDSISCVLDSYSIRYMSFFPDGQPRMASVDLSFLEVKWVAGAGNVTAISFEKILMDVHNYSNAVFEAVQDGDKVYGKTRRLDASVRPFMGDRMRVPPR